jgi:hypothetical protein
VRGKSGGPFVVGGDGAADGSPGELGQDVGDVIEVERVRRGQ